MIRVVVWSSNTGCNVVAEKTWRDHVSRKSAAVNLVSSAQNPCNES